MYEPKEGYCDKCHRKKEDCVCNVAIKPNFNNNEYLRPSDKDYFEYLNKCGCEYPPPKKNYYKSIMTRRPPYYKCPFIEQDLCDMECFIPLIAIVAMLLCSDNFYEDNIQLIILFSLLYLIIL